MAPLFLRIPSYIHSFFASTRLCPLVRQGSKASAFYLPPHPHPVILIWGTQAVQKQWTYRSQLAAFLDPSLFCLLPWCPQLVHRLVVSQGGERNLHSDVGAHPLCGSHIQRPSRSSSSDLGSRFLQGERVVVAPALLLHSGNGHEAAFSGKEKHKLLIPTPLGSRFLGRILH